MHTGLVWITGEWLAAAGWGVVVFAYWRKIRLEEAKLTEAFGVDFQTYRRHTWAIVPGLF